MIMKSTNGKEYYVTTVRIPMEVAQAWKKKHMFDSLTGFVVNAMREAS